MSKLNIYYIFLYLLIIELLKLSLLSNRSAGIKVYHCTSSTCNPFKWVQIADKINEYLHRYPLCSAVWYPHLKFLPSIWLYRLSSIFVHLIPAYILDTVTKVAGGRPM